MPRVSDQEPDDSSSTLVHQGKNALTFTEMAAFVRDVEARPLARLLTDLPGLMVLADLKHQLVVMVLRKKIKEIVRKHMAVEEELDTEVRARLKNLQEGTDAWDVEYQRVMDQVKNKHGIKQ